MRSPKGLPYNDLFSYIVLMNNRFQVEFHFRNALIFDGDGAEPFNGDIGISDGKIDFVTPASERMEIISDMEYDLTGMALSPGFIDAHTHDDHAVLDSTKIYPKLSQGVTTIVAGNCGISLPPLTLNGQMPPPPLNLLGNSDLFKFPTMASYRKNLAKNGHAVNLVYLIGHSSLRIKVMDDVNREANSEEIRLMHNLLTQALNEGASGFSTGLFYPPNKAASEEEVVGVASAMKNHGGIYTTHMRDEGDDVIKSIDESLSTAKKAGVPLLISHHKCTDRRNWGRTRETLQLLEEHRPSLPLNFDIYPYTAGSTILQEDQVSEETRIMVTWSKAHPERMGQELGDIAREWEVSCKEAARRLKPAGAIYFQMHEEDVQRLLKSDIAIIGSDGIPEDEHPHPRLWGTFPRIIGHYARDLGLLTMSEAIHKMTGLPAKVFGLGKRGRIAPGHFADLVIFDPKTIIDKADYDNPKVPSEGINAVWVNGKEALNSGSIGVSNAGRLLQSDFS